MIFHLIYFSNYMLWLKDFLNVGFSLQFVWFIIKQESINLELGSYYKGIYITSGLFFLFKRQEVVNLNKLKFVSFIAIFDCLFFLLGAYFYFYIAWLGFIILAKFNNICVYYYFLLLGLGYFSWGVYEFHISIPINKMLDSGIDLFYILELLKFLLIEFFNLLYLIEFILFKIEILIFLFSI